MKKLSEIIHQEVSHGRRDFLTLSSMSLLGLAVSSVFPSPVKAENLLINSANANANANSNFDDLDAIDFYVIASNQENVAQGWVRFEQDIDEAQYLAQVMFQELMKFELQKQNFGISERLGAGMRHKSEVLGMSDGINWVEHVHDDHSDYFANHMVEYVSGLLQRAYSTQKDVTVADRKLYNSWDMVKVNANIHQAEKGQEYQTIIGKLYAIATHFCQGRKLTDYKKEGQAWARQLIAHYSKNEVLDELVSSFKVQESGSSFEKAMKKVYNTINKVRALNISSGSDITEDELQKFQRIMTGSVYSGFAMNMNWGSHSEKYTVLANKKNFDDVVTLLKTKSGDQSTFWNNFFNQNSPDQFWQDLNDADLRELTLLDGEAKQRILNKYPDLGPARGLVDPAQFSHERIDSLISVFTLLLGIGHFTWATATDREELSNPVSWMDLGSAFTDLTLNLIQLSIFFDKVSMFVCGNGKDVIESIAMNMKNFSEFLSNLTSKGKYLNNAVERLVASKLYLTAAAITRVIEICFVALAVLGMALAAYSLYGAIVQGDFWPIVFASVSLLAATVGLVVSILGLLGVSIPVVGWILAAIGIAIAIAQWLYELFNPPSLGTSPIADYTTQYIRGRELEYEDTGAYICRVYTHWGRNMVCAFDAKTMNTDWDKVNSIADHDKPIYTQPGALVTSPSNDKIYNFSNIQQPTYGNISTFFSSGANLPIDEWNPSRELQICEHAVESQASNNNTRAAIFVVRNNESEFSQVFLTSGLENAPSTDKDNNNKLDLGMEWQEHPLDVVAINGFEKTMFLIFTTRHIYQVRDGVPRKIISDFAGEPNAKITYGLNALALGTNVNLFYRLGGIQAPTIRYHYLLTRDDNGDYTSMRLLRTINNPLSSDSPIVGRLFKKTSELVSRMDFMYHDGESYARYGAIMGDSDDVAMALHNGVEFQVPDNGFRFFYKNAFIPK